MAGNVAAEGNDAAARSSRMMMWMMPLMSLWIGFTLPAALGVYWIVNSLLYAIQEKVLTKYYKSHMEDELSEKEKQKREDRLRRMEADASATAPMPAAVPTTPSTTENNCKELV